MKQVVSSEENGIINFLINYVSCQPRGSWAGLIKMIILESRST